MRRKDFLKNSLGFLGMALVAPRLVSCSSDDSGVAVTDDLVGGTTDTPVNPGNSACTSWPTETEGPFPTKNPGQYQLTDISGDRTGILATIKIKIENTNDDCNPLENVLVDIWHCDKDGNYSQYGGTNMQPTDYTGYNFLRGRQITDSNGYVAFKTIFPGWYQGRATHIHVHIYKANGTSLKVTQIAFPEGSSSAVTTVNTAAAYGYTKGMSGYTYNSQDNVFNDDTTGQQLAAITGSISEGYNISAVIKVGA